MTFTDAAPASGLAFTHFGGTRSTQLPEDMGSGAAWGDYDNDGDDDLFIVNVSGPLPAGAAPRAVTGSTDDGSPAVSRLFRNDAGRFVDVTVAAGLLRAITGMGAAWGDADGDGWRDLVVTSFDRLYLFRNRGNGTFEDVSAGSGLSRFVGFWTGASWADYDRDGDLDLYVCGYVQYRFDPQATRKASLQFDAEVPVALNPSSFRPERNLLLRNDGRRPLRGCREGRGRGQHRAAGACRRPGPTSTTTAGSICTSPTTSRTTRCSDPWQRTLHGGLPRGLGGRSARRHGPGGG